MKKMNKKGFTLIELLVVIAIIGLLSTMAVISLNSARAKSRDAKRLSDVKQMATALSLLATENENAMIECGTAGTSCGHDVAVNTVSGTNPSYTSSALDLAAEFDKFSDPSGTALCVFGSTAVCNYTLTNNTATFAAAGTGNITLANSRIRFYTETQQGSVAAGRHMIDKDGIITQP